jgi:predicted permease
LLLEALPLPDAERLVIIEGVRNIEDRDGEVEPWAISYPDAADWSERVRTLTGLAAHSGLRSFNLRSGDSTDHVDGEMVAASYFDVLGVAPLRGRLFTAEEDRAPGAARVAMLGHDLWLRRWGGDEDLVGRTIELDGESYEIVGILPRSFAGVTDEAEVWLPLARSEILGGQYTESRRFRWLSAVGRLGEGVGLEAAQAELDAVAVGLAAEYPDTNQHISGRLVPLREAWLGPLRRGVLILFAASGLVLLVACTNVAGLLLVRGVARRRDLALRSALGADRGRLVRQLLVESLLLALAGGALAALVAHWGARLLLAASPVAFRGHVELGLDGGVLGFLVLLALLCGLGFGAVPAWMATRGELATALREGGHGGGERSGHRLRGALVVGQIALALVLVFAAGVLLRSFRALEASPLGYRAEGLLTVRLDLKGERWSADAAVHRLSSDLLARVGSLPGVELVAIGGPGLPTDAQYGSQATLEDPASADGFHVIEAWIHHVSPAYFETLGIPVLAGRPYDTRDDATSSAVVVVSRTAAERLWPERELARAVGERLKLGGPSSPWPWFEVVGVVEDARHRGVRHADEGDPDLYFSFFQIPPKTPPVANLFLRHDGVGHESILPGLREVVRSLAPGLAPYDARTLAERVREGRRRERFLAGLMGLFALLALLLAALGVYGMVSQSAARRRREVGIRMALGAGRSRVVLGMLRSGLVLALAGLGLGLAACLASARVLRSQLYGVDGTDPASLVLAASLLLAVALGASYVPARRAARLDPARVLREE